MRKFIIAILFMIMALVYFSLENHVESSFKLFTTRPKREIRTALSDYFAYLFCKQGFGYALIGAKPMSFVIDLSPIPLANSISALPAILCNSEQFLFRSWKWKEYYNTTITILIHKKLFIKTYEANKELFQKVLGNTFSAPMLLHTIATSEKNIFEIINHNEVLLGILLGYGKENAALFARYEELFPDTCPLLIQPTIYFPVKRQSKNSPFIPKMLLPSTPFKTVEEEQAWFERYFNNGSFDPTAVNIIDLVFPVGFRVADSEETRQLIKRYTKAREVLIKLFSERDCLEVIEKQLYAVHPLTFDEMNESWARKPLLNKSQR